MSNPETIQQAEAVIANRLVAVSGTTRANGERIARLILRDLLAAQLIVTKASDIAVDAEFVADSGTTYRIETKGPAHVRVTKTVASTRLPTREEFLAMNYGYPRNRVAGEGACPAPSKEFLRTAYGENQRCP